MQVHNLLLALTLTSRVFAGTIPYSVATIQLRQTSNASQPETPSHKGGGGGGHGADGGHSSGDD
jgi:hypothetical protein